MKKYHHSIYLMLLGLAGFILACGPGKKNPVVSDNTETKYGVPVTIYKVAGSVISEESGNGLTDIEIGMLNDITMTDSNGNYILISESYDDEDSVTIHYQEKDPGNHFHYEPKDTVVSFAGNTRHNITIKLKRKK